MGSVAPPYKGLPSMPTNHFAFVTFSLLRVVPFTTPANMSKNYCLEKTLQIYKGYFVESKYFTKKMMYLTKI